MCGGVCMCRGVQGVQGQGDAGSQGYARTGAQGAANNEDARWCDKKTRSKQVQSRIVLKKI